jgi:uncharacterized protein (DUF2384 family)
MVDDVELPEDLRRAMKETFISDDAAREWLHRPIPMFKGETPADLLRRGRAAELAAALDALNMGMPL